MRAGAARSALCPQALLEKMVTDPDARVRGAVVRTGRLGEADLSWLGADRDDHVRIGVALANGCPAALLDAVIRDRSVQVRKMVASRDDLGEGALLEGRGAN